VTYDQWKAHVDRYIMAEVGLHADDLPDYRYRDDYENVVKPATTARRVVKAAKKEFGL